jgi:type IV pilus assembly protein PilY1
LLGEDDLLPANSTTQSTYGIKDTLAGSPVYADLRSSLNSLTMTQVGSGITAYRTIACSVSCSSGDGWVVDLPDSGERVNIDPKLQLGTLTFASNVPSNSICDIGGYSWLNFMDYKTGLAVSTALDHAAARRLSNSLAAGVNFLRLSDGRVVVNVISTDNQPPQTFPLPVETPPPAGKRVSWREVLE